MFGVVLWSNSDERKAVIWCEDHGDLAYYRQPENGEQMALDAGDWVQFDMTTDRHLRFAHNPRLIAGGGSEGLADALMEEASQAPGSTAEGTAEVRAASVRGSAEIIPFAAVQAARDASRTGAAALVSV